MSKVGTTSYQLDELLGNRDNQDDGQDERGDKSHRGRPLVFWIDIAGGNQQREPRPEEVGHARHEGGRILVELGAFTFDLSDDRRGGPVEIGSGESDDNPCGRNNTTNNQNRFRAHFRSPLFSNSQFFDSHSSRLSFFSIYISSTF